MMVTMTHIDDWMDRCRHIEDEGEAFALFMFEYFRMPAWKQIALRDIYKPFKLFCIYEDREYRVTGASRMGDVWLARDFERDTGYDLRVDVAKCSKWSHT